MADIKKLDQAWKSVIHDANTEILKLLKVLEAAEAMLDHGVHTTRDYNLEQAIAVYKRFRESGGGELSRAR